MSKTSKASKASKTTGAKSLGEAMAKGLPIIWEIPSRNEGAPSQISYTLGEEKEAISLLLKYLTPEQTKALLEYVAIQIGLQLIPYDKKSNGRKT